MPKYRPLGDHLRAQFAAAEPLVLGFQEIEGILGRPLPRSAKIDRTWWANTLSFTHASQWMAAGWRIAAVSLEEQQVTFRRGEPAQRSRVPSQPKKSTEPAKTPGRPAGSYDSLHAFLVALPAHQTQVALALGEFAALIGRELPPTAWVDVCWWANTLKVSPQGKAWLSAGWEVAAVYLLVPSAKRVVFRRRGTDQVRRIQLHVRALCQGAPHGEHIDSATLRKWLRLCRTVGWYFEGTVLYEMSGAARHGLSASDEAEIEEDYGVCKRELNRFRSADTEPEG